MSLHERCANAAGRAMLYSRASRSLEGRDAIGGLRDNKIPSGREEYLDLQ